MLVAPTIAIKDKSLDDLDNLPDTDLLTEEIAENLESALGSFREIIAQLKKYGLGLRLFFVSL